MSAREVGAVAVSGLVVVAVGGLGIALGLAAVTRFFAWVVAG